MVLALPEKLLIKQFGKCISYITVLFRLSMGEVAGYDVVKDLEKEGVSVSSGTVFYQLGLLEKSGYVAKRRVEKKSVYSFTPKGVKAWKQFREEITPIFHTVQSLMKEIENKK